MADRDIYSFPECLHVLGAAMHMAHVSPRDVEIILPFDDWWKLYCALQRKFPRLAEFQFSGRGARPDHFMYDGFRFVARKRRGDGEIDNP